MAGMQGAVIENADSAHTSSETSSLDRAKRYRTQSLVSSLQGRFPEAEGFARESLRLRPGDPDVLNELGVAIWRQGRHSEAEEVYRQACRIKPDDFKVLNNLGLALYNQGRIDEAGDCYRRALHYQPDAFDARMNLGIVLSDQGKFDEAMKWFRAAHELRPESADILQNLGMNLGRLGRWHEAIDYYEQALRRKPDFPEVHRNLGYALLICGDYARGWPEHEWRLRCLPHPGYKINRTFWNGDALPDRTILLHTEQGLGDTLQFVRFASMVKQRVGRVLVLSPTPLLKLVARCNGVDMAFECGSYEPRCDVHAPLLSLPSIFGTTLETLPAQVPYLILDKVLVDHWGSELAKAVGIVDNSRSGASGDTSNGRESRPLLIGIAWQGNPSHPMDHWRSFPLACFAPLAALPGVRLISLQTTHGLDQLGAANLPFPILDLPGRRGRDFMESAAIMTHLDLVITPDTAVAHLAGALGLRVWTGLCDMGEWRWLAGRDDSPWYPTMRLFRQTTLGHWDEVFERMTDALRSVLEVRAAVA
jgi:Flp pilus assembly protein TadD